MGSKLLFANNASTTLYGSLPQGGSPLVMAAGSGSKFPNPTPGSEYFKLTLFEKDVSGNEINVEVVDVISRTGDTCSIYRDTEGTVGVTGGYSYPTTPGATVYIENRLTKESVESFLQAANNLSDILTPSAARFSLGLFPAYSFTPTLVATGATFAYSSRSGYYLEMGDLVFIRAIITLNPSGTTLSANGLSMNLPVAVNANAPTGYLEVAPFSNMAASTNRVILGAKYGTSTGVFQIQLAAGVSPFRPMNANDLATDSQITITGFYFK